MKQYKTTSNLMDWLAFVTAAAVYCLTTEPTASPWDRPEFITTDYKLEVGHPPGVPFFMLVANLFSQFAPDVTTVAKTVNYMSAFVNGAYTLLLFQSIIHLVRKLITTDKNNITRGQFIIVMSSGLIDALVYTFGDTLWFSAVEGEIYTFSSLFTAAVSWLILKWEGVADRSYSDRWTTLIAYLTGLDIGIHLLNLLYLPVIVLVYYYKKTPNTTTKGSLLALVGSGVLVAAVLYGIVPGIVKAGGWFELLFVDGFGMSLNSGVVVCVILPAASLVWDVYESYTGKNKMRMTTSPTLTIALLGIPFYGHEASSIVARILVVAALGLHLAPNIQTKTKEKWHISARAMNTALLCTIMTVIGYSSYTLIVTRSTANAPMNQSSPEDISTLGECLGRKQYGTRPLFYDPAFSPKMALDVKDSYCISRQSEARGKFVRKEKTSSDEKDSYTELPGRMEYEYVQDMLFPRMYSSPHAPPCRQWADIEGYNVPYDQCGEMVMVDMPTQRENIKFLFSYQLNFMYWRCFMWNFAGRQNDIQNNGGIEHDNWITGIPFIDNLLVGNQESLPQDPRDSKGHNVFYCLPLILGLIGLFRQVYHSRRGIQQFWVVFFLFFMAGIAIMLYLNQTPTQPRERDYAYASSFYAFAVWVGMGVAGIIRMLRGYVKMQELPAAVLVSMLCLFVPIQMAGQTWDNHDRSGRSVIHDFGQNYLMTLREEGDPIIYANDNNDTFPLWHSQETEGFRTDTRICNLSYLQADWYINQMRRPAYDSPSLLTARNRMEYVGGQNEYISIHSEIRVLIDSYFKQANELAVQGNTTILLFIHSISGKSPHELKEIVNRWMLGKNDQLKELLKKTGKEIQLPLIPTDSIAMKIDKEAVYRSDMKIPEALGDSILEYTTITLRDANDNPKRALYKNELMMLEMFVNANWERPIYMAIVIRGENRLGMGNHFTREGFAYRFTPFDTDKLDSKIDSEKMYDNLMSKFKFGDIDKPGICIDENVIRMCYTHRRIFTQLVERLIKEGKKDKALAAPDYTEKMIPAINVPYDWVSGAFQIAEPYYQLGQNEKANKIIDELASKSFEHIIWYLSLNDNQLAIASENFTYSASSFDAGACLMEKYKSKELAKHCSMQLDQLHNEYVTRTKGK